MADARSSRDESDSERVQIEIRQHTEERNPLFKGEEFADSDRSGSHTPSRRWKRSAKQKLKENSVMHEKDQDACPFISIRRDVWFMELLKNKRRTHPFQWSNILSSYSVKNDFMFYPPVPSYRFAQDESGKAVGLIEFKVVKEIVKDTGQPRHKDAYVVPSLNVGAIHGFASTENSSHKSASFEIVFIPWSLDLDCYRIKGEEVIVERKIRFKQKLFPLSFGAAMPCSIIRPQHRMSSHIAIFFHCNGEDIGRQSSLRLLSVANALHMTVFVPEYPGYGLFEGTPSEASLKGAMEHFIEYLFAVDPSLTPSRILLIGHSIGTGLAVHIAQYIHEIFGKFQRKFRNKCVCPGAFLDDLRVRKRKSYFHHVHKYHCAKDSNHSEDHEPLGSEEPFSPCPHNVSSSHRHRPNHRSRDPYEEEQVNDSSSSSHSCGRSSDETKDDDDEEGFIRCSHNVLGGIILLSPFASIHSVEYRKTLHKYNVHPDALSKRLYDAPINTLFAAPDDWRDDCSTFDAKDAAKYESQVPDAPFLFSISRFISFNRFPTIEVVQDLQKSSQFFKYTPILFVHGLEDNLVPPQNSVAIATKLRQCPGGDEAKVFCAFYRGQSHNNLNCLAEIRRFYKDEILKPHLKRQKDFWKELNRAVLLGNTRPKEDSDHFAPVSNKDNDPLENTINSFTLHVREASNLEHENAANDGQEFPQNSDILKCDYLYFFKIPENEELGNTARVEVDSDPLASRENTINFSESASLNNSLLHTFDRTCTNEENPNGLVAAATCIHIAIHAPQDCYDVGSVASSAVQHYSLSFEEARILQRTHKARATLWRILRALFHYFPSMFVLAIGITHGVLLQQHRLQPYLDKHNITNVSAEHLSLDARVIVWSVLEGGAFFMFSVLTILGRYLSLGHISRRSPDRPVAVRVFFVLILLGTAICFGIGVLMGFIVALTPHTRGGVEWSKWSVLPYERRVWVSYIPRWGMVAAACLHLAIMAFFIIKNH